MSDFEREYKRLNTAQRQAVDTIDGPLLIIAGPGTGKTQLLSARVANILKETDTPPQNILCLTFTENGAENMRERLTRFIGDAAYDVRLGTYHAFGSEIISRFPQYFTETRLQSPIDELSKHQLLASIIDRLSYDNPLKQTRHHIRDLISTISEVKRALLTSADLRSIARENNAFIDDANLHLLEVFDGFRMMPRKLTDATPYFSKLLNAVTPMAPVEPVHQQFVPLASLATQSLQLALETAEEVGKTAPLTAWKNQWLAKDANDHFIFDGRLENRRIAALADVFERYEESLADRGLYDFDDMILRAIKALEQHDDLRFSLQEQYLYIMLDEFQDTNAAQFKLVTLLTNNPVNEGRPNVMAVGDDDQAIYAFQGADYSNMLDFYNQYKDVKVINLTENYRSHEDILSIADAVSNQITARLQNNFEGMTKKLVAANSTLPKQAVMQRQEFNSDIAQYAWIGSEIQQLIAQGTPANEIAVLAPKHKQLEPLVPYLNHLQLPVRYEKRENILETPVVKQLLTMSKLVLALHKQQMDVANSLWPTVLSFEFWQLPVSTVWQLSWQVDATADKNWTQVLLADSACRRAALLFLSLAARVETDSCEQMLDYLIGNEPVVTGEAVDSAVSSPLKDFYINDETASEYPTLFYQTLSHLTVLRAKLREYQATLSEALRLPDLISFVELYEEAGERMLNTSPYNQQKEAVQLMTAFKAKGLEFGHVFVVCCQDDVWGGSSRGNSNRISLPPNLQPIRYAGATDDERLRIFFVALTRAKQGLHLTSFTQTFNGKKSRRLKYMQEVEQEDGSFKCTILPEQAQSIMQNDLQAPELALLQLDWQSRHLPDSDNTQLAGLLSERLSQFALSPTHFNTFLDTQYGGPQEFFFRAILRFPHAPTINGIFGSAIHETLEWVQQQVNSASMPAQKQIEQYFSEVLKRQHLTSDNLKLETGRGVKALRTYMASRGPGFKAGNKPEYNFRSDHIMPGNIRLTGKIDLLEIDSKKKEITVVDYKTGNSYSSWKSDAKLHKYRQQLYFYKLLIEGSPSFSGYKVTAGRLEFIEPDNHGVINSLTMDFKPDELNHTKDLIKAVWKRIMALDFPDISDYEKTLTGIKAFESSLLAKSKA